MQTTWFRAQVASGVCPALNSGITKITVLPALTIANAGPDQYLCALDSTQLNGNTPVAGKGVWHQIAGSTVVISNDSLPNTWIKGLLTNTSYSFEWSISNGVCPASRDTVVIYNYPAMYNTIDSIAYVICSGQSVLITAKPASGGNGAIHYQWQQSADSITWVNMLNDTLSTLSFSPATTVYLRRMVTAYCTSLSNAVKVTVQPGINNNNISSNQVVCYNTAATSLTGTTPTGGDGNYQYQWQSSIDTGKTWINIPAANTINYSPGILLQTIQFRRLVSTTLCSGPQSNFSNVVVMTVVLNAKATFTYTTDKGCVPFNLSNIIQGVPNINDTAYNWYANNVFIGNGISFPGYILKNGGDSVAIQLKAYNHCTIDSFEQEFYTYPVPVPSFTVSDSTGCGPLTVSITNTSALPGFYSFKWNLGNGVTSTSVNPPSVTYPPNPNNLDTTYTITLTEFSICDTITVQKNIIVHAAPQVFFTPDKTVGCSPMTVRFNNTSRGVGNTFFWNFGDGFTLATNQDSLVHHTYHSGFPVTYKASLISTNFCGSDTLSYLINVAPNPIFPDFAVNGTELAGCNPHTVHFINNTSGATTFQWNFGDGNILTTNKGVDTVTHVYTQSGTFTTTMLASNSCTDTTIFKNIIVLAIPNAAFTATPSTVCLGDSVHFLNQTDSATSYIWNFGDGGTSTLTNPAYLYNAVGTYTPRLIAIREYGTGIICMDSAKTKITKVNTLPGLFNVTDSIGNCIPFTITFTNQSGVSIITTWDFGDGKKDTGDIVQHTFTVAGAYTVNMTAIDPGGCTFNASKNILINGPKGSFVYTNGVVCQNNAVFFQATIVNADSIHWDFGDGFYATTNTYNIYHTYQQSGNFIPTMNLYYGPNCSLKVPGIDTIKMDILKIGFTVSAQNNCGNSLITFKDTSYSYFGLTSHSWNFGDGSAINTSISPSHTYTSSNNWPIQLIIQSSTGCSDTLQKTLPVIVHQTPLASAQADSFGCVNNAVHYHAIVNSADSVILMNWIFPGNVIKTGLTSTETYTAPGTYTTSFVAGSLYGCYDTATVNVTVNPIPNVSITTASNILCLGTSAQLYANGALTYQWSPVNFLSCTTCSNPIADPNSSIAYIVTGFNSFGCSNSDSVNVLVIQPFSLAVLPNDTICIGQSVRLAASGAALYNWFPSTGLDNPAIPNPLANPAITTKYRVIGTDNNNCFRDTAYVNVAVGNYPVINLGQDKIASTGTQLQLTPSFINGPINIWSWAPPTYLSCSDCEEPIATVENNICYTVTGTNIFGCAATDTICIKAFCESAQVFIPNAFTPDGDGKNDILMVRATGIQLVKSFKIYNRWGQVVFDRANFIPNDPKNGWDGRVNGVMQPSEVYVYTCEVVCDNGTPFVYKGNVAIIK
jgi:gliding motility-associated-like protein